MIGLLQRVNWVDICVLILLIRITYISSRIGVGKQILPLVLLVLILSVLLYNYGVIASFFVDRYAFRPALSLFLCYVLMTVIFFVIYHFTSRVTGFCFAPGEIVPGGIEKIGGTLLGLIRSTVVIGIILIGFLLTPVKFVEDSVRNSFLGSFYVSANIRIYATVANLALKSRKISHREELSKLFSKKGGPL